MRDTSQQALESIQTQKESLTSLVYNLIKAQPSTCSEIESYLNLRHQTASARISELNKANKIIDSGERRTTESGRKAIVWRIQ